jgi:F0F1-type ATP synthase delta subunit
MKLKLPDSVASSQDLLSLSIEIQNYSQWLAHETIKKHVIGGKISEQPMLSQAAKDMIRMWSEHNTVDKKALEQLVTALKAYDRSALLVNVTLSAPPTNQVKSTVVSWFRDNISHDVLVNFDFNSIILGGMVVRCGSRIFDWSFRRQILSNRNRIPEVLRNV